MRGWLGLPPGLLSACPDGMQGSFRTQVAIIPSPQSRSGGRIRRHSERRQIPKPVPGTGKRTPAETPTNDSQHHVIVRGRSGNGRKRGFAVASGRSGFCFFFPKEKEEVLPRQQYADTHPQSQRTQKIFHLPPKSTPYPTRVSAGFLLLLFFLLKRKEEPASTQRAEAGFIHIFTAYTAYTRRNPAAVCS